MVSGYGIAETVLTIFGSGAVGWFFSRRLYRKQVDAAQIQNDVTVIEVWKTLALDLKAELKETRQELTALREAYDNQSRQIAEMKKQWKKEHPSG